jgi:hypothetical protein
MQSRCRLLVSSYARVRILFVMRFLLLPPSWLLAACAGPLGKFAVLLGDEYRVTVRFLERDGPCLRCSGIHDGDEGSGDLRRRSV